MTTVALAQNAISTSNVTRHSANFHPDIWGDYFLSYAYASESTNVNNDMEEEEALRLKEEVKSMMTSALLADEPTKILNLIDSIQRLGVSYHFEEEIEQALNQIYSSGYTDDELHIEALRFRLLRQQGFNVSCNIFNKFRTSDGHWKEELKNDVEGILNLYEAAYLGVHHEDILEEALAFCTAHLNSIVSNLRSPLATKVSRALKQPIRKGLPRLEAAHYIPIYQRLPSHNHVLLTFAKLDFRLLQNMHREELRLINKWWKDLDFTRKLPFIRDRLVEGFFWILGVYFEPHHQLARRFLTKVIMIASVIDDIYDAYGTLEELVLFTNAIERWDIACIDQLPEYMKLCYTELLNIYAEMKMELSNRGKSCFIHYAIDEMKKLAKVYLVEAKWMNENYVPTMEEYMRIALASCGYSLLSTTSFVGMEHVSTKAALDWSVNPDCPKIIRAASIICRLMDDIVSHEFEQARGHVASAVECYMKENGVSEEETTVEFRKRIKDAWKDINEACLKPTDVPLPFLTRVINLTSVIDYFYKDGDEYTHVGDLMKSSISALLIHAP